jgi:diaminohydroxyphosphoribosylaminopyrimidine deaminase/5-amino-6-(5-phosphoribosylamino)uracil reductase
MQTHRARAVSQPALDEERAWQLLRALAQRATAGRRLTHRTGVRLDDVGRLEDVAPESAWLVVDPDIACGFVAEPKLVPAVASLLELYLPLCIGPRSGDLVIGHVGQSLDGQIATASGASRDVSGPENIVHMHRLRALCDAVVVGRRTVECDNPQLTTRLVPGDSPTRVVIDPSLRLSPAWRIFNDGVAATLVVCGRRSGKQRTLGQAEILELAVDGEVLPPRAIVDALRAAGLRRIFIEGGGITLSRFIEARVLNRLHVTICPLFIGSGRPGIVLPGVDGLERALRPVTRRFTLGEDVLFDMQLDGHP